MGKGQEQRTRMPRTLTVDLAHVLRPDELDDDESLHELSESIREHGMLFPVILRRVGRRFVIVDGARRFRAAELAGLEAVPATLLEIEDDAHLETPEQCDCGFHRLSPREWAEAVRRLGEARGLEPERLATITGRSVSAIGRALLIVARGPADPTR